MRLILVLIASLCFYPFVSFAQADDSTGFQIGIKSSLLHQAQNPRFSAEIQYLANGNRWVAGYQYLSLNNWTNRYQPLSGFYGEGEFIDWELADKWRVALPLRLYFVHDHYWEGTSDLPENAFLGILSVGADLQYRISHHWKAGLTLGYLGYGTNLTETDDVYGLFDGSGLTIYYRF